MKTGRQVEGVTDQTKQKREKAEHYYTTKKNLALIKEQDNSEAQKE